MADPTAPLPAIMRSEAIIGWPVWLGLLVMYAPTYYTFATTVWDTSEEAHGPLILLVALYLIWQQRDQLRRYGSARPMPVLGTFLMLFGLLLYVLGRSQDILMFDIGSQIPVLAGILLIAVGGGPLRRLWFPLCYIGFMIPLPGFFVDALTGPLKEYVSELAEGLMYHAGYPVARSGVTLTVGQYELLVADACSGLNSMFSLSALGVLYVYWTRGASRARDALLVAAIIPIAFFANVARVVILVLVTYYFGDEAGQGFVHGFAGVLLFIVALACLFALDRVLGWVVLAYATAGRR